MVRNWILFLLERGVRALSLLLSELDHDPKPFTHERHMNFIVHKCFCFVLLNSLNSIIQRLKFGVIQIITDPDPYENASKWIQVTLVYDKLSPHSCNIVFGCK